MNNDTPAQVEQGIDDGADLPCKAIAQGDFDALESLVVYVEDGGVVPYDWRSRSDLNSWPIVRGLLVVGHYTRATRAP